MTKRNAVLLVFSLSVSRGADAFTPCYRIHHKNAETYVRSSQQSDDGGEPDDLMHGVTIDGASSVEERTDAALSTSSQLADFGRRLRRLSILRPAVPNADFSAPLMMLPAGGSSYTRLWTPETWKRHTICHPHSRYFRHLCRWRYSTTTHKLLPITVIAAGWALVASCIHRTLSPRTILVKATKGTSSAALLFALSMPLALLLTIRTNVALERLNETRVAWGRLVLHARSFTALLRTYVLPLYPAAAILAAKHVAIFGWLLKSQVRGEDRVKEIEVMAAVLGSESADYQWLASHPRPVWAIPVRLRQIVAAVANSAGMHDCLVPHSLLEKEIAQMEDVAGVCERILASPIPPTHSRHLSRILILWLAALPIGLISSGVPTVGVVIATAFTSYALCGLDEIGMEMELPFSLLPLQELAAGVQNSVGLQLIDNECSEGPMPVERGLEMPTVPL